MKLKPVHPFPNDQNLHGIPNGVLNNHLDLYRGYVRGFNQAQEDLLGASGVARSALLKQRNVDFDGAALHEIYFSQLIPGGSPPQSTAFLDLAAESYGSHEAWQRDFVQVCHVPGPGWAATYLCPQMGLVNGHIEGHSKGIMAGCRIVMIVDLWEHAYECYTQKMDYVHDVFSNMNWNVIESRLSQ